MEIEKINIVSYRIVSYRNFRLWFNFKCLFGLSGCGVAVVVLGWASYALGTLNSVSFVALLRYSEGANFLMIVLVRKS